MKPRSESSRTNGIRRLQKNGNRTKALTNGNNEFDDSVHSEKNEVHKNVLKSFVVSGYCSGLNI